MSVFIVRHNNRGRRRIISASDVASPAPRLCRVCGLAIGNRAEYRRKHEACADAMLGDFESWLDENEGKDADS